MRELTRRGVFRGAAAGAAVYSLNRVLPARQADASVSATEVALGVSGNFGQLATSKSADAGFGAIATAGFHTVRLPVAWESIQREAFSYDWGQLDDLQRALLWYGLDAIPVILGCPAWLRDDDRNEARDLACPSSAKALKDFGRFAVQVKNYFCRFGERLGALEVWSEPNESSTGLQVSPNAYAAMVNAVGNAFAEAEVDSDLPSTTVVAGGILVEEHDAWIEYVRSLRGQAPNVVTGLHVPPPSFSNDLQQAYYSDIIAKATAAGGRSVWLTTTVTRADSAEQATRMQKAWRAAAMHQSCAGLTFARVNDEVDTEIDRALEGAPLFDGSWQQTRAGDQVVAQAESINE